MDFGRLFPPVADRGAETYNDQFLAKMLFSPLPRTSIGKAIWIDGGSAPLFSTPTRCIGILKIAAVHTQGLARTAQQLSTYLASITDTGDSFVVRNQALHEQDDRITASLEREIPKAILPKETTPEQLLDVVRTLAEHSISSTETVHDGSTRTLHPYLQQHLKANTTIAKSCSLLTSKQRPLGMALLQYAPRGTWYVEIDNTLQAARLHDQTAHVLFVENCHEDTLGLARAWAHDAALPGYPYPLLLADQLARVTNNERDVWKMILATDEQAIKILTGELAANNLHAMFEHILYGKGTL